MRRILSAIAVIVTFAGLLFAQEASLHRMAMVAEADTSLQDTIRTARQSAPVRRRVDFMADVVKPYNRNGDSVVCFVGNFAAHHNGAVISCDSAVRYTDTKWGFFGKVLVNQDSIYIYGDSAVYNGEESLAQIFSPIIKVVDGDALLYTYNFQFNTEKKIGSYSGGGVLVHDNNIIESLRGYYDADSHDIICVDQVELHGADYDMKSDSIIYNTSTELARFFTNSEIWNAEGRYLSADEGCYDKAQDLYRVTRNGYMLSEEQEMWGDTLSYYRSTEYLVATGNIQADDFKQKMLTFGGYAEYWSGREQGFLTRNPVVISYDTTESDSIFLRADSMFLYTVRPFEVDSTVNDVLADGSTAADVLSAEKEGANIDAIGPSKPQGTDAVPQSGGGVTSRPMQDGDADDVADDELDELEDLQDSVAVDSVAKDSVVLTPKQLKRLEAEKIKQAKRAAKEGVRKAKAAERKIFLDSIAAKRQAKITAQLDAMKAKELERTARDSMRRAEKRARLAARGRDVSALDSLDSVATMRNNMLRADVAQVPADSLAGGVDSISNEVVEVVQADSSTIPERVDSMYRLVKGYRNVKMYRSDAQMICDSLVSDSRDSIIHLFINPVLWNNANQLSADKMDVFTKNQQIERAEFIDNPIMVSQIDSTYYNQVAGKLMVALFKDNEIYRNNVDGNVQTIYFQRENEQTVDVTEMVYLESASASYYIEKRELVGVTYRNNVPFKFYPINMIPPTQSLYLKNFKWVPELRPTREMIFDRTIRPSEREQRVLRERPRFGIVERMDRRKEQLMYRGEWYDREDVLSPEIVEWRDSRE